MTGLQRHFFEYSRQLYDNARAVCEFRTSPGEIIWQSHKKERYLCSAFSFNEDITERTSITLIIAVFSIWTTFEDNYGSQKKGKCKGPLKRTQTLDNPRDTPPPLLSREEPLDEEGSEDGVQTLTKRPRVEDIQPNEKPDGEPARTKRTYNIFTEEQEENIVNWLKDDPIMYNKGLKEYKMKVKKATMWTEKALELQIAGEWFLTNIII